MHNKKYDKTIILIPSYNEKKNLEKFINNLNFNYNILVLDDSSTDNTVEFLEKMKIPFVKNNYKLGYEKNLIQGFKKILEKNIFETVVTMDADGEHPIENISEIMKVKKQLVIGNRRKKNRIIEFLLGKVFFILFKIKDPSCGFRVYDIKALRHINNFTNMNFYLIDFLVFLIKNGYSYSNFDFDNPKRKDKPRVGSILSNFIKYTKILIYVIYKKIF